MVQTAPGRGGRSWLQAVPAEESWRRVQTGTGSNPPGCNGVHFASRRNANQPPAMTPCIRTASAA